jgi:hypothetical protein
LSSLPTDHILIGDNLNKPKKVTVSGDITLKSGSTAFAEIQPNAVTYSKMQKVSTANRVLGSLTSGGPVTEIEISTNMISNNGVGLDKLAKSTQANVVIGATAANQNFSEQKVNNSMLTQVNSGILKGRKTTGVGEVEDITATDVLTILGIAAGAAPNVPTVLSVNQTFIDKVHIDSSTQGTHTGIDILSATNLRAGVMTPADKVKLDSIATGATSSGGTVTSVEGTLPVVISPGSSGDATKTPLVSVNLASGTTPGLLPSTLFNVLTGVAAGSSNYVHPPHTGDVTSIGDGVTMYANILPSNLGGAGLLNGLLSADGTGQVHVAIPGDSFLSPHTLSLSGDITSVGLITTYNNIVPENKGGAGITFGILKANGVGTVSAAVNNVDYHMPGTVYPGTFRATGDVIAFDTSDERLKTGIKIIPNALSKVQEIKGVEFEWNKDKQTTHQGQDVGVIAQDVEKVLPTIVITREDGYKAVRYEKIIPLLIEAIKELKSEVELLKSK